MNETRSDLTSCDTAEYSNVEDSLNFGLYRRLRES